MIEKKRIVICVIVILISFLSGVSITYFTTVRHNRIGSERIREELNRANESYAKLESLHERIREELRESNTRITSLESELRESNTRITSLESELEIAREKLNDVRGATKGLEESIRGNIDSITNIREAIDSLREITKRLESYIDSVSGIIG